jgi:hypothetical protein
VNGYRAEFVQLVGLAALLNPDHSDDGRSKADDPNLPQNRDLGAPQPSNESDAAASLCVDPEPGFRARLSFLNGL